MSQRTAQDNAVRAMDERRAAQQRPLPPLDPVMPPHQAPQYGNNGGNGGYSDPRYQGNPGYSQDRPSRWGTAGAAAAGAVLGSVLANGAHARQAPVQQQLPGNVPPDVGSIGPVDSSGASGSPGVATVPNPMNPDSANATTASPQQERAVHKKESGIGWFGWIMLGLIGFTLYKVFTRRKVNRPRANYKLGD